MNARRQEGDHVNDATLIQLIDGALGDNAARRVEGHLAECDSCGSRLRVVRERSDRMHAIYRSATPVSATLSERWLAPARRAIRPHWSVARIGVAAAAVLVVSLLVSPVYGYINRKLAEREAVGTAASIPGEATVPSREPAAVAGTIQEPPPSAVRFQPSSIDWTVRFASAESGAHLEVRETSASYLAFEAGGAAGQERPVLFLPSALDVENANRSGGVYRIWVPSSIKRLRVEVAGREVSSIGTGRGPIAPQRIDIGR
jgi:hypothetical protein